MAEVFVAKRGTLDARSIRDLRKAGIVVAEVESLTEVQFTRATETISHSDMLWATLQALCVEEKGYDASSGKAQREQLARNLFGLLDAAHTADRSAG